MLIKRLGRVVLFELLAASVALATNYSDFPQIKRLYDNARILIYANNSGSRNITGLQLKEEISAFARLSTSKRVADANQIYNLMTTATSNKLIKRAAANAGQYERVLEIKDKTGKIVYYVTQNGAIHCGTPRSLAINYIYPANGATGITNSTLGTYSSAFTGSRTFNRPTIVFNKGIQPDITNTYIVGDSNKPWEITSDIWSFSNFSGAAGATYTMRVYRNNIPQIDGETNSSCGTVMTDVAGVCTSTFTMR